MYNKYTYILIVLMTALAVPFVGAQTQENHQNTALELGQPVTDFSQGLVIRLKSNTTKTQVYPTNYEQYMLELINRGRADPQAEADRYSTPLNEGISSDTISSEPKQPLAFNLYLIDGARKHSQWMLDNDTFSHDENGKSSTDRMQEAGYELGNRYMTGENIAWHGTTNQNTDVYTFIDGIHEGLYVDKNINERGHRKNLMRQEWKEMGVGLQIGSFRSDSHNYVNTLMETEDYAYSANTDGQALLTGVAYDDTDEDDFYTPSEGLGEITITAQRKSDQQKFSTLTWTSGGYSLPIPPGTYSVYGKGDGLGKTVYYGEVLIEDQNVKIDFRPDGPSIPNQEDALLYWNRKKEEAWLVTL